jgi:hypothetical protein
MKMTAKQLSVFIENRQGRLGDVLRVLKDHNVNILSMSLADTTEYGLLRFIVNNPEDGRDALIKAGFSSMLADVLIIKVPHVAGGLRDVIELIASKNVNIEYMYGLTAGGDDASIVIKTNELDVATEILKGAGISTLTYEDIAKMA